MTTPRNRDELREMIARAICEGGFHAAWPDDGYNDRAQKRAFLKQVDALLSGLDEAGLRIVPKEPTLAMVAAADAWEHFEAEYERAVSASPFEKDRER